MDGKNGVRTADDCERRGVRARCSEAAAAAAARERESSAEKLAGGSSHVNEWVNCLQ